ncbi:MAG: tRNA lysidine(34) synthetase TilS [Endomicrobium sp.]|jgi:tRNA(Ile)-lysidine synthase|nr:tRNA lysidine(34) synthetase TilS [Endomicrobium sp.]
MKAWDIFYKNIFQNGIIVENDKVILAVSGGIDSICMLHMFWRISKKINIDFLVVNFNHSLRRESTKESDVVKEISVKLGIKYFIKKINVKKYSEVNSVSIETAGRELRYSNLEKIAKKYGYNKIATAHNSNDNAETMLMWILRGTGNFIGIPQKRELKNDIFIIRPLLPVKRKLIEEYVINHNLQFCIDNSNFLDIYTRNKIRLLIMPIFESINPMFIEHVFNLTCIQNRENIFLNKILACCLKECIKSRKNCIFLDLKMFLQYNEAIRFRILKNILPQRKYNSRINFIMHNILLSTKITFRLSSEWIFKMTLKKACFIKKNIINEGK